MLRSQHKSQSSFNLSTLNATRFSTQTTTENMERQIDNYTRRLQQDKRKFFRAQQNYSEIKKQYEQKNKQLQKLKSKQYKNQIITLKTKITGLQATLDQSINSYNQSLAKNNRLKSQIDQLRKQKKTQTQKLLTLNEKLQKVSQQIEQKQCQIQVKKSIIQKNKQSIIKAKQTNDNEVKQHQIEVKMIKSNFDLTGKDDLRKSKEDFNLKTQSIDTQPLLKLRLKNIIAHNKEKIKIIQQYRKNMHLIYQNFQQIKQQSGIQDLQEITKTFLKQQDQNTFIYQYMNQLNLTIENMKQTNDEIRKKVEEQKEINIERRQWLTGTPEDVKRQHQFEKFKEEKSQNINELNNLISEIAPKLSTVLRQYNLISQSQQLSLNQNNIQSYISLLQQLVNCSLSHEPMEKSEIKEEATKYTRQPPNNILDQIKEKQKSEDKLLQKEKLKQLASQFWEKRKNAKGMAGSKGLQSNE